MPHAPLTVFETLKQKAAIAVSHSTDWTRRIVAVQRFFAETDKEALSIAHDMVDGVSAVARFDFRQAERQIHGAATTMKGKSRWCDER